MILRQPHNPRLRCSILLCASFSLLDTSLFFSRKFHPLSGMVRTIQWTNRRKALRGAIDGKSVGIDRVAYESSPTRADCAARVPSSVNALVLGLMGYLFKAVRTMARGRIRSHRYLLFFLAAVLFAAPAVAETRLALVITNAAYPVEIGVLNNPYKDGEVIAAALESVGFEKGNVSFVKDADQPTLRLAVADFIERIEKSGPDAVVFLYYSGHGAADRTERGENYLIPVGARIALAKQLPILGVSLTEITKSLERVPAKARFVVIDACRNVAFTKGLKDAAKGFIPERKLDGMMLAFATRPGETSEDNNIYALALASILPTPGLEANQVFKETQLKVADLSKGTQIPWTEDGLLARFKFKDAEPIPARDYDKEMEIAFWNAVKDSKDPEVLGTYLERFPEGTFAALARVLSDRFERESAARKALAAREEELKRAEEAKAAAEAKRIEEERKLNERRRQDELAKARIESQAAREAARISEEEKQALLKAAEETRKKTAAAQAAQEVAAAREEELKRAEESKKTADAKEADEQRRIKEAKLEGELKKAKEDARKAQEAASRTEAGRLAALKASEEAHKTAKAAKVAAEQSQIAEEANKAGEVKRAEEQRRVDEAKREAENKKALEDAQRAAEDLKVAETERLAALRCRSLDLI
jgi:Caspase domain